jgi:hypothetical protein
LSGGAGAAGDHELQIFGLVTKTLGRNDAPLLQPYPQVAAIFADQIARSIAGAMPTSVGRL